MSRTTAQQIAEREAKLNDPAFISRTRLRLHRIQVYGDMDRPAIRELWHMLKFEVWHKFLEVNKARITWWIIVLEPSVRVSKLLWRKSKRIGRDVKECYHDAKVWIRKDTNRL